MLDTTSIIDSGSIVDVKPRVNIASQIDQDYWKTGKLHFIEVEDV